LAFSILNEMKKKINKNKQLKDLERYIKRQLETHLLELGFKRNANGRFFSPNGNKESIRQCHLSQRREKQKSAQKFITEKFPKVKAYFASGNEVIPEKILPRLEIISSGTIESDIFRVATLTWSIPVSAGYGRRMRFLIWDDNIGKIIGIMALGDPVFNLNVRDEEIGWNVSERKKYLVNIMDAYVLGALPPYSMILGGKLVACLVKTQEIRDIFFSRYNKTCGIISGESKRANLVMVTTTSALGRSSIYNRLSVNGEKYFESIGFTAGYGHFHVPNDLFDKMREYLFLKDHMYSNNNRYGHGPNWRLRAIRATLELIGMNKNLLNHGIKREVYISRLAKNADQILRGETKRPYYDGLLSVDEVSNMALQRWVIPRSLRRQEYITWKSEDIRQLLCPIKTQVSGYKKDSILK